MPKSVPILWSRSIKFLSFFLIAYGLAMVFIPQLMRTPVASILFDNHESFRTAFIATDEPQSTFLNVLSGLLGTVTTGWAIQMAWLAHKPFRTVDCLYHSAAGDLPPFPSCRINTPRKGGYPLKWAAVRKRLWHGLVAVLLLAQISIQCHQKSDG